MKNYARKLCLQKKFLTFWNGNKCYFFLDFIIYHRTLPTTTNYSDPRRSTRFGFVAIAVVVHTRRQA